MQNKISKTPDIVRNPKLMLKLGLIGIVSVLITIISDIILIGKPSPAYDFLLYGTESMWDIPTLRIAVGAFVGVVALPFQLLGLVPVYYSLKTSGKALSTITIIPCAHALLMGVAFHISYAFSGSGWKLNHCPEATQITTELMQQYDHYWTILMVIMIAEILFGSVIYSVIVAKGKTLYPRWMAIFSPASVVAFTLPLVFLIPYPIGGYIAPACLNISTLIFFVLTQTVTYRR
jgi:hypothetical protein